MRLNILCRRRKKQITFSGQKYCGKIRINSGFVCLFDLILYVSVNNFLVMSGGSSLVEPVLSSD